MQLQKPDITYLNERLPAPIQNEKQAKALIDDAFLIVKTQLKKSSIEPDIDAVKLVVASMVIRVLNTDNLGGEYTQKTQTAGPYTTSYTYNQTAGALYITKREKELLGVSNLKVSSVEPYRASIGG